MCFLREVYNFRNSSGVENRLNLCWMNPSTDQLDDLLTDTHDSLQDEYNNFFSDILSLCVFDGLHSFWRRRLLVHTCIPGHISPLDGFLMSAAVTDLCSVKTKTAFWHRMLNLNAVKCFEWLSRTPHTTYHKAIGQGLSTQFPENGFWRRQNLSNERKRVLRL